MYVQILFIYILVRSYFYLLYSVHGSEKKDKTFWIKKIWVQYHKWSKLNKTEFKSCFEILLQNRQKILFRHLFVQNIKECGNDITCIQKKGNIPVFIFYKYSWSKIKMLWYDFSGKK